MQVLAGLIVFTFEMPGCAVEHQDRSACEHTKHQTDKRTEHNPTIPGKFPLRVDPPTKKRWPIWPSLEMTAR
jgi:hypothetical protein